MKKIKSLLAIMLVIALMLTAFAGCGGNDQSSKTNGPSSQEPIKLKIWADFPVDGAIFDKAIAGYQKKNSNVDIEFEIFPGGDRVKKLSLAKESNELPNLMFTAEFCIMDEAHQGYLMDLSEVVNPIEDELTASSYEPSKINGKHYMLPMYTSTFGLLYNADIFRAAGLNEYISENDTDIINWNLDDFENVILPTIKDYFGNSEKYPLTMFCGNAQADTYLHSWLRMYGGYVLKDGKVVAANDNNTVRALNTMVNWCEEGYVNSNVITRIAQESTLDFSSGVAAINFGQYTNRTKLLADMENGNIDEFDLRVATVPGESENVVASYIYGAVAYKNNDEKRNKVAIDFLNYLANDDDEALYDLNSAAIPAFKRLQSRAAEDSPIINSYTQIDNLIYDFTASAPGYVGTRQYLFPALQAAFSEEKTVKAALEDYQTSANKIIGEYSEKSAILK